MPHFLGVEEAQTQDGPDVRRSALESNVADIASLLARVGLPLFGHRVQVRDDPDTQTLMIVRIQVRDKPGAWCAMENNTAKVACIHLQVTVFLLLARV